jgi:hypothetical protein
MTNEILREARERSISLTHCGQNRPKGNRIKASYAMKILTEKVGSLVRRDRIVLIPVFSEKSKEI